MDEVGQPGVAHPGTGDGSRDDATGSRAGADDLGSPGSDPGDSLWPDGDPLGMAWPGPGRASGRATSDWYGQATARNSHDRYPTSGGDRHPSESSGAHARRLGERHPSDPRGLAPLRPQPDPSADRAPSTGPEPSAGPEPPTDYPSHSAPTTSTEASRGSDGNRYWSRTSTGPARGSVPLTDALTAETIEAPLLAAAAARPYGEPVSASIRLPQVFVPRPRSGESNGRPSAEVPRVPNDMDNDMGQASVAVPVSGVRPDTPATPSVVAGQRSAQDVVPPDDARSSAGDGRVITEPTVVPTQPRPVAPSTVPATSTAPAAMAATDRPVAAQYEVPSERRAADDRASSGEFGASGEYGISSSHRGSEQPGTPREPDGPVSDRDQPRPPAIPMPGRSPEPADTSPPHAPGGPVETVRPGHTGAERSDGQADPAAEVDASDDVPPIFRQTANPQRAEPTGPTQTDESHQSGEVPGWSTSREVRNRRGPWLRGAGSIRSGRFGGRPMSMFSSSHSPYEEDRRREPDATPAEADVAPPDADGLSAPTVGLRPATYPAVPEAAAEPRREVPPDPDESWYVDRPAPRPSATPERAPEPPGAAEHDWDDLHRFTLLDQPTLPHRVPAKPDVPFADTGELDDFDDVVDEVADPPVPDLDGPELSRIASRLRHDEESVPELPDELDVAAVLAAVRQVNGVRSAALRPNPGGVHILRLDLADDADAGRVSRQVARLLKERMGLAAEPRRPRATPGVAGDGAAAPVPAPRAGSPAATEHGATDHEATEHGDLATSADRAARAGNAPAPASMDSDVAASVGTAPGAVIDPSTRGRAASGPATGPATSGSAAAPGFRPTMPGKPGAFLPGMATVAPAAPLAPVPGQPPRIVIDQVHVSTLGTEATVEVRLHFGSVATVGRATGPAVDAYLLRLAAQAAADAIDSLISAAEIGSRSRGPADPADRPPTGSMRCYIEHAGVVPFGSSVVAVVVVLVSGDGRVEQFVGSALVAGDPRHSIVRATLAAVNRRLESLLT